MGDQFPVFTAAAVQASPVFLDREATVEKACRLIRQAGAHGARLIVFPEAYIPTFPWWPGAHPQRELAIEARTQLYKNAVEIPSLATEALGAAAREAKAYVVMGMTEREKGFSGTLYNTLLYIDDQGRILGKHRKLVPTFEERCIWGMGDGSGLQVYETPLGKVSGLVCGNNLMTLAKYALLAKGEQLHAAVWPQFSRMRDYVDVVCRNYALEGQCFVIVASGIYSPEQVPQDFVMREEMINNAQMWATNGGSAIIAPDGTYVAGPVYDREEIVYGEINIEAIVRIKAIRDGVGHYARPDIARLWLNEEAWTLIQEAHPAPAALHEETLPGEEPPAERVRVRRREEL